MIRSGSSSGQCCVSRGMCAASQGLQEPRASPLHDENVGKFQWTISFGCTQTEREEAQAQMVVWEPHVHNSDNKIILVQSLSLTTRVMHGSTDTRRLLRGPTSFEWRCTVQFVQTHQDVVVTDNTCASQCEEEFKNCNVSAPPKSSLSATAQHVLRGGSS